jgi:hypothetical protein
LAKKDINNAIYRLLLLLNIIIILLHGLGRLTYSAIDALPSFTGATMISSPSRFVVEGVFRKLLRIRDKYFTKPEKKMIQLLT